PYGVPLLDPFEGKCLPWLAVPLHIGAYRRLTTKIRHRPTSQLRHQLDTVTSEERRLRHAMLRLEHAGGLSRPMPQDGEGEVWRPPLERGADFPIQAGVFVAEEFDFQAVFALARGFLKRPRKDERPILTERG